MKKLTKSTLLKLIREQIDDLGDLSGTLSKSQHAEKELEKYKSIRSGDSMKDINTRERNIIQSVEDVLSYVAENDELHQYRAALETFLKRIIKKAQANEKAEKAELEKQAEV